LNTSLTFRHNLPNAVPDAYDSASSR
jgi:hypothetical protein